MSLIKNLLNKNDSPISVICCSWALALFANIKSVNWALVYGYGFSEGIMPILYIGSTLLLVLGFFIERRSQKQRKNASIIIASYILLFYFFSSFVIGPSKTSLPFVFCLVIIPLIIPSYMNIDARAFIMGLMTIPVFSLQYVDTIFVMTSDWGNSVSMDVSYGYLVPIVANIIYIFCFLKEDSPKIKTIIALVSLANSFFFVQLLLHGSRGPLLSIFVLLFVLWFFPKTNDHMLGLHIKGNKLFSAILILILLLVSFFPAIEMAAQYLGAHGISSYSITKIIDLANEGNLSNGRNILTAIAIDAFWESPILGWGFDRFDANTGLLYPHNFILQILYDGGLLYFLVIMIPVIRGFIKNLKSCTYNQYVVMLTLFFSSVPGALVSHNLYMVSVLWLFFGSVLSDNFIHND